MAEDRQGNRQTGWGETPLSVQWVWPSSRAVGSANRSAQSSFVVSSPKTGAEFQTTGHALEVGHAFQEQRLNQRLEAINKSRDVDQEPIPHLAGLVCCSPFDLAVHDAFGKLCERPVYETYGADYLNSDLSEYLVPAEWYRTSLFQNVFHRTTSISETH